MVKVRKFKTKKISLMAAVEICKLMPWNESARGEIYLFMYEFFVSCDLIISLELK